MKRKPEDQLVIILAEMAQNDLGMRFFEAFEAYHIEIADKAISAVNPGLEMAVGFARQSRHMLTLMRESQVKAKQILEKEAAQAAKHKG